MSFQQVTGSRVVFQVIVSDVPGNPGRRHYTLCNAFCEKALGRELQEDTRQPSYDHIHIPGDIDSDLPLQRWVILDLNVTGPLSQKDVLELQHQCFRACYRDGKV